MNPYAAVADTRPCARCGASHEDHELTNVVLREKPLLKMYERRCPDGEGDWEEPRDDRYE